MKMPYSILVTSVILLIGLIFTGCVEKEIIVKTKIQRIYTPIPKVSTKPEFIPYQASIVEIDKKKYYLIDESSGLIMVDNYQRFKLWSMRNYILLLDLRKDYESNIVKDNNETKD